MNHERFEQAFHALTDHEPYPWQQALYERLIDPVAAWPANVDIPTGLGKTAIIPVWLIALTMNPSIRIPRWLAYVVNRRTIVDQATGVVERLRDRLQPDDVKSIPESLQPIRTQLNKWSGYDADQPRPVLAVSTLRGALADNQEWRRHPTRPAIIVGTVDMIGSRLLFRGYRDGWRRRPTSAGLLGRDTLLIHDEAHLTPAFQQLLERIVALQNDEPGEDEGLPPRLRVMQLSATTLAEPAASPPIVLTEADHRQDSVQRVLNATKRLYLHEEDLRKTKLPDRLAALALAHRDSKARVVVYVRRPEDAAAVHKRLIAELDGDGRVELLTGTIRGFERDRLVEKPVMKHLMESITREHSEFLVSTAAGEVGADLDADHMVCDLTTLDGMIQRLGRVNRRGRGEARIDLVVGKALEDEAARDKSEGQLAARRAATRDLIRPEDSQAGRDVSPRALRQLVDGLREQDPDRLEAYWSPRPQTVTLNEMVLDAWTLTSVRERWPLAQPVDRYLHGLDPQMAQTTVAWRLELNELAGKAAERSRDVGRIMRTYRLRPHETLTERPDRVADLLLDLKKVTPESEEHASHRWCAIQPQQGPTRVVWLDDCDDKKQLTSDLANATVLLPAMLGGLNDQGMLDGKSLKRDTDVADVRGATSNPHDHPPLRRRLKLEVADDQWHVYELGSGHRLAVADERAEAFAEAMRCLADQSPDDTPGYRVMDRLEFRRSTDGELWRELVLLTEAGTPTRRRQDEVKLAEHVQDVVNAVDTVTSGVLPERLLPLFVQAAELHDRGKADPLWQKAAGNLEPDQQTLAKPGRRGMNWRLLGGYRHEFGSLRAIAGNVAAVEWAEADRDLLLHLIATHHGHGRPHFMPEAMRDPAEPTSLPPDGLSADELARRFDRLQRQYGRWGLAWLEAVFRAADAWASGAAGEDENPAEETPE